MSNFQPVALACADIYQVGDMALPRLPDFAVAALSLFVLVTLYLSGGFNLYIGIALTFAVAAEVFLRVTKRGRWRPSAQPPEPR